MKIRILKLEEITQSTIPEILEHSGDITVIKHNSKLDLHAIIELIKAFSLQGKSIQYGEKGPLLLNNQTVTELNRV